MHIFAIHIENVVLHQISKDIVQDPREDKATVEECSIV